MVVDKRSKSRTGIGVYLAHSAADAIQARKIRNLISRQLGAKVFTSGDLSAGEDWLAKLRHELEAADAVVALLTAGSAGSSWVLLEIGAAWGLRKPIIPIVTRREALNTFALALNPAQAVELTNIESPLEAENFLNALERSLAIAKAA